MINALRYTEELERAGFTPEQAKKSVDAWMSLMDQNFATKSDLKEYQLATKSDLKDLRLDLESQIKDLRLDLESRIKELRSDLESQIKELRSDLESQIKELRSDLESQIKELRSETIQMGLNLEKKFEHTMNRMLIQLGALIVATSTIGFTILGFLISR